MAYEQSRQLYLRPEQAPSVEQLEQYRGMLMTTTLAAGKKAKYSSHFDGVEFLLPGSYTEWSLPDNDGHIHIERDRSYAARYRDLGIGAKKLIVVELDSVRVPNVDDETKSRFSSFRRIYRFGWQDDVVYDSQAFTTEMVSEALTVMVHQRSDTRAVNVSEIDESANPFRFNEHILIDESDVDKLTYRTLSYGEALILESMQGPNTAE